VLECVPDFLSDSGAARLSQDAAGMAGVAKAFGEQANLRALSAAFRAFKGDEQTANGHEWTLTEVVEMLKRLNR